MSRPNAWEIYFKWFDDEVIGLYCRKCRRALSNQPATRNEWTLTPGKLSTMIATHIKEQHPHEGPPEP